MDESIREIESDVAECRERLKNDLQNVRAAVDPGDMLRDSIRRYPLVSVGVAFATGTVAASTFLPKGRRSPLGVILIGCFTMAYRGFFMAATPLFAKRISDYVLSPSQERHVIGRTITAVPPGPPPVDEPTREEYSPGDYARDREWAADHPRYP